MVSYHTTDPMSATMKFIPVREIALARSGALLAAGAPRYPSFDEYVFQLASPMSQLPGCGLLSFYDPLQPEVMILVQGERVSWCLTCDRALESACACPF